MTRPKTFQIGEVRVDIWHDHHILTTTFKDDLSVTAAANDDADSVARAHDLGYDSTWTMSLHHELAHHLLSVAYGLPYSLVIRGVAVRERGGNKEDVIRKSDSDFEEAVVMDFQKFCQLGIKSVRLAAIEAGQKLDLEALKAELRRMTA